MIKALILKKALLTVEAGSIVKISESQFKTLGGIAVAYKEEDKAEEVPEKVPEEKAPEKEEALENPEKEIIPEKEEALEDPEKEIIPEKKSSAKKTSSKGKKK